jgi:hypothetical protein
MDRLRDPENVAIEHGKSSDGTCRLEIIRFSRKK